MTPTEKDAMALAVLDEAALSQTISADRKDMREARAHLASRIAELEETREVLFGGLDRDRDNITTRNLAVVAINALARERDRATRAEAELAAVRANAERYVWLRDRAALGFISTLDMCRESEDWDAEIDAARGGE